MGYIHKSFGTNRSERFLAKLCDKSFLSLWTYPNLFYSKGKELCDVLVVCGDYVFIISDKSCKYTNTGNYIVDWSRWWKKTIQHSLRQILSAERNIFENKKKLFLDSKCEQEFPLSIPDKKSTIIHRIIIAKGASKECQELYGERVRWTFPLTNEPQTIKSLIDEMKYSIGDINPEGEYVHVLDEHSFEIVFKEFDTVTDFSKYFEKRKTLFRSGIEITTYGEDCLVGMYLKNMNNGERDFISDEWQTENKNVTGLHLGGDVYSDMLTHPQYIAKKNEDKISYCWDLLIKSFSDNIISGEVLNDGNYSVDEIEESVRIMALETRLARRFLSSALLDAASSRGAHGTRAKIIPTAPNGFSKSPYIFVFAEQPDELNKLNIQRQRRKILMLAYADAFIDKYYPSVKQILVLGLDYRDSKHGVYSEDVLLRTVNKWDDDDSRRAKYNADLLGIFNKDNMQKYEARGHEYPEIEDIKTKHKANKLGKLRKSIRKESAKNKRRRH